MFAVCSLHLSLALCHTRMLISYLHENEGLLPPTTKVPGEPEGEGGGTTNTRSKI